MHEATADRTGSEASVNLACFEVGGGIYAVDVVSVREIVRNHAISPLPGAPSLIEGVIDLRGRLIPVVDLARVLGRERSPEGDQARIVVIDFEEISLGLQVDAATDVLTLEESRFEEVPRLATDAGYDVLTRMLRREGAAPVMVLSLRALVESVHRSAPPRADTEGAG